MQGRGSARGRVEKFKHLEVSDRPANIIAQKDIEGSARTPPDGGTKTSQNQRCGLESNQRKARPDCTSLVGTLAHCEGRRFGAVPSGSCRRMAERPTLQRGKAGRSERDAPAIEATATSADGQPT